MRGINRQSIFEDQEDYEKFMETIKHYKEISRYEIYAYCLMGNHVHLLLKTGEEPLEQIMRRICGSYVYWYNWKYKRIGNLFQDRFKSEAVENDEYLITVQRYIHQNPLKAGLVSKIEEYKWSSYREYVDKPIVVQPDFLLKMYDDDQEKALKSFMQFNKEMNDDVFLELEEKRSTTDEEAREIIKNVCQVKNPIDLQKAEIAIRNTCLRELKEIHNLSIRQIERLTGINRGVIFKA